MKNKVKMVCKICGKSQPRNESKSNEDFDIYDAECVFCKGKCGVDFGNTQSKRDDS